MAYAISFAKIRTSAGAADYAGQSWDRLARLWIGGTDYNQVKVERVADNMPGEVIRGTTATVSGTTVTLKSADVDGWDANLLELTTTIFTVKDGTTGVTKAAAYKTVASTDDQGVTTISYKISGVKAGDTVIIHYVMKDNVELKDDSNFIKLTNKQTAKGADGKPVYKNFRLRTDDSQLLDVTTEYVVSFEVLTTWALGEIHIDTIGSTGGKVSTPVKTTKGSDDALVDKMTDEGIYEVRYFKLPAAVLTNMQYGPVEIVFEKTAAIQPPKDGENIEENVDLSDATPTPVTDPNGNELDTLEPSEESVKEASRNSNKGDQVYNVGENDGVTLPKNIMDYLTGGDEDDPTQQATSVTVETKSGSATIPIETLEGLLDDPENSDAESFTLVVREPSSGEAEDLDAALKSGNYDEDLILRIIVEVLKTTDDGVEMVDVDELTSAESWITIKFPVSDEVAADIHVMYLNDEGILSDDGIEDTKVVTENDQKYVVIKVSHLTTFIATTKEIAESYLGKTYHLNLTAGDAEGATVVTYLTEHGKDTVTFTLLKDRLGEDWTLLTSAGTADNGITIVPDDPTEPTMWTIVCTVSKLADGKTTFTLPLTNLVPSVFVGPARIDDGTLDALQTVTPTAGTGSCAVVITTPKGGMTRHDNGEGDPVEGAWVGFEVAQSSTTAPGEPAWDAILYTWKGDTTPDTLTPLDSGMKGGNGKGIAFYYDVTEETFASKYPDITGRIDNVTVQFRAGTEGSYIYSKELKFTVDLKDA